MNIAAKAQPTADPPDAAPNAITDGLLVRRALDGDREAFGGLYDRYVRLIRVVCFDVTGSREAAEDLTHETFLRAWRSLAKLRKPDRVGSWLTGIALRLCKDWRRRIARERSRHRDAADFRQRDSDVGREDSLDLLRRAIARLPRNERLALHLFYLQDNAADDARRMLGLSRSGFYKTLERARKRLRKLIEE